MTRGLELTGAQIRAARALLKWTAEDTAGHAKISRKTVERLEQTDGLPVTRELTLDSLRRAFETAGIEFVGAPEEGPGVRLWKAP